MLARLLVRSSGFEVVAVKFTKWLKIKDETIIECQISSSFQLMRRLGVECYKQMKKVSLVSQEKISRASHSRFLIRSSCGCEVVVIKFTK
jgi:hypothetical protein